MEKPIVKEIKLKKRILSNRNVDSKRCDNPRGVRGNSSGGVTTWA